MHFRVFYFFLQSGLSRYYVYEKETEREIGDFITVFGKKEEFNETKYEGRFSFKEYLLSRGIRYSLRAYSISSRFEIPLRLRKIEKHFLSSFDSETATLIDSLLFDRRNNVIQVLRSASSLGILYLFSMSGVYLSLALRFKEKIERRFFSEKWVKWSTFGFLFFISPFYLQKLGFWRVVFSRIVVSLFPMEGGKKIDSLGKASLVGIILYLFSFRSPLRNAYLLGVGVSLNNAFLESFFARFSNRKKKFVSSFSIHLFLLPLVISFSSFHLFSYLYSLFLPFFIIPFRLLSMISFASVPFPMTLQSYSYFLSSLILFLGKIDVSIPIGGGTSAYLTICYYLTYYSFFYFYECGFHKLKKAIPLPFFIGLLLRSIPFSIPFTSEVTFINVGQGDAILIRDKSHVVLLDTGGVTGFDLAKEVDIPYLYSQRIYHLDAVIASHGDFDHIGAFPSLKENFCVKRFIDSPSDFPLKIGNMEFINLNQYGENEGNDSSLVLSLEFMNKKWLFMGDASKKIEQKIIEDNPSLRCDVLKVGHHGSDTSTSSIFLKTVQPKVAIISVGGKNKFGHPDRSVLNRLSEMKVTIRRTDIEGTIRFYSFASF